MIKVVSKSGNLANLLKTVAVVAGSNIGRTLPAVPEETVLKFPVQRVVTTAYTSACGIPARKLIVVTGPSVASGVRFGHTDAKVPDFTDLRRAATRDPKKSSRDSQDAQRLYTSAITVLGASGALYAAKVVATSLISYMAASADVLALAQIEVNKADIPEGKNITFTWRGKPLFVRHRTDEEIQTEAAVDLKQLRDPEHDNQRTKDPKWLVVIGVCTHLGCVPISHKGEWGGYYCPCHGSHYDASGRIRKGPAPTNLEVPTYEIRADTIIVG